ncbi:hypothetical protein PUN28_010740 [Cardiocondyla obscurior]|uniref:Uncharacterized protein n=1 Tax=Cardiocondyla obscurior TaxID=286306 RepID=A0AAW2FL62_9HYME
MNRARSRRGRIFQRPSNRRYRNLLKYIIEKIIFIFENLTLKKQCLNRIKFTIPRAQVAGRFVAVFARQTRMNIFNQCPNRDATGNARLKLVAIANLEMISKIFDANSMFTHLLAHPLKMNRNSIYDGYIPRAT